MPVTITFQEKDFNDLMDALYITQQSYMGGETQQEKDFIKRINKLEKRVENAKKKTKNLK